MPEIVAVIPVHRRAQMAIETVRMLRHQTVPVTTILVGDSRVEAAIARKTGCEYVQYPNRPLSSKWQAGVWRAGDIYPDAVLILGSDTWLTPAWCETGLQLMQEGSDVVGRNSLYIMHLRQDGIEVIHRGYKGVRAEQPMGAGRMISRAGMRALDWALFRERKSRHCDSIAMRAIKATGLQCALMPKRELAMTIKCDNWLSKHTFADAKASTGLQPLRSVAGNTNAWLASAFPGALEALDRLRRDTW